MRAAIEVKSCCYFAIWFWKYGTPINDIINYVLKISSIFFRAINMLEKGVKNALNKMKLQVSLQFY